MGNVAFSCPAGHTANGYLATAASGDRAIVVLQEWWGLNTQICGVADRFAAAGYTALAPDLYAGRVTGDSDEADPLSLLRAFKESSPDASLPERRRRWEGR